MKKIFTNDGVKDYCIAEVEANKTYKITIETDKRIHFQYVITNDEHSQTLFLGSNMDKRGTPTVKFTHILPIQKTGHLCIRNKSADPAFWSAMTVTIEEV